MNDHTPPSPGKLSPRLLEDLLDYDPRYHKSKKFHLLADPSPPWIDEGKAHPLRTGPKDCRHDLVLKPDQSNFSADGKPEYITTVAAYCSKCRHHFTLTLQYAKPGGGFVPREPCALYTPNKLHHFRYVHNKSQRDIPPDKLPKYEGYTELHYFKCSCPKCPVSLVIKITPPRLGKALLKSMVDPAMLETRRAAAVKQNPDRFENMARQHPSDAYYLLIRYIWDALKAGDGNKKRLRKDNKNFMVVFGSDCDKLLRYLEFEEEEVVEDEELKPYWNLPSVPPDGAPDRIHFFQDVAFELAQLISNRSQIEDKINPRFEYAPVSALEPIQKCLGCWNYPRRARIPGSDNSEDHPHYLSLGACRDFTDDYILYAYVKQIGVDAPNRPYYFDCLCYIQEFRNSHFLEMEVAKEVSSGHLRLSAIHQAYKFFNLDPYTAEGDDYIVGLYRSRVASAPRQKEEARECLRTLAKARDSVKLEAAISMTPQEAYEFLGSGCGEKTTADFLGSLAITKIDDGSSTRDVVKALRVLANSRNDNTLHVAATNIEIAGASASKDLTISQAYSTLQITETTMSDENVWVYYKSLMEKTVGVGSKESLEKALRCIGEHRASHFLLRKVDNPHADFEDRATAEHPVGLQNHGNTCYLNSLLQFYYTVKPVREIALNFDEYQQTLDEDFVSKKVGGLEVGREEIKKAQKFVRELGALFSDMKTASTTDVTPTTQLAELALLSTKEKDYEKSNNKVTTSPVAADNVPAKPDFDRSEHSPSLSPPPLESVDVEMTDHVEPDKFDQDDSSSEATLVNSDETPKPIINDDLDLHMPNVLDSNGMPEPFPRFKTPEDIEIIDAVDPADLVAESVEKDSQIPEKPPPIPPRNKPEAINTTSANEKSTDLGNWALQQDVGEVSQNVLFRLSCAIKPSPPSDKNEEQKDLIRDTFFGQSMVYTKKEKWELTPGEWNNLMVYPAAAAGRERTIYEALDVYFDQQLVNSDGKMCQQYTSIKVLPPVLQILIQRTGYDKATGQTYKNENWITPDETIFLDRYLDDEEGKSNLKARREKAWEYKNRLRVAENRKAVLMRSCASLSVPEAMLTTMDYLKQLQEEDMEGLEVEPSLIDNLEARRQELMLELEDVEATISDSHQCLNEQFTDMRQHKYTLQAVFMHRGTTGSGHYWIYIYDFKNSIWREYNDTRVNVVTDRKKIFSPDIAYGSGNPYTPYYLVYVRDDRKDELVEALCREIAPPQPQANGNGVSTSVEEVEDGEVASDEMEDVKGTSEHIERMPEAVMMPPDYEEAVRDDPKEWKMGRPGYDASGNYKEMRGGGGDTDMKW